MPPLEADDDDDDLSGPEQGYSDKAEDSEAHTTMRTKGGRPEPCGGGSLCVCVMCERGECDCVCGAVHALVCDRMSTTTAVVNVNNAYSLSPSCIFRE